MASCAALLFLFDYYRKIQRFGEGTYTLYDAKELSVRLLATLEIIKVNE